MNAESYQLVRKIQGQVGTWSTENFGAQDSKQVEGLVLGPLAPLMGICEEVGELFEANQPNGDGEAVFDAVGDIGIYLCDYAARRDIDLATIWETNSDGVTYDNPFRGLVTNVGKLQRANLKHHQAIREHDANKFVAAEAAAIKGLLDSLQAVAKMSLKSEFADVLSTVFVRVVKPRDWVNAPVDGSTDKE